MPPTISVARAALAVHRFGFVSRRPAFHVAGCCHGLGDHPSRAAPLHSPQRPSITTSPPHDFSYRQENLKEQQEKLCDPVCDWFDKHFQVRMRMCIGTGTGTDSAMGTFMFLCQGLYEARASAPAQEKRKAGTGTGHPHKTQKQPTHTSTTAGTGTAAATATATAKATHTGLPAQKLAVWRFPYMLARLVQFYRPLRGDSSNFGLVWAPNAPPLPGVSRKNGLISQAIEFSHICLEPRILAGLKGHHQQQQWVEPRVGGGQLEKALEKAQCNCLQHWSQLLSRLWPGLCRISSGSLRCAFAGDHTA